MLWGRWVVLAAVTAVLAGASAASACMIPVFRYAMDRWPPDIYAVLVFHEGPLSAADAKAVEWMQETANSDDSYANCDVRAVDLSGKVHEELRALWQVQAKAKAKPPWMVVLYPRTSRISQVHPAWTGPFSPAAAKNVLDSPKRREVARRLLAGDAAAWVLLESGKPTTAQAATKLLARVQEMVGRLLAGDATVWSLLESDEKVAEKVLARVLKQMEATLELPNPDLMYADPAAEAEAAAGEADGDDEAADKEEDARLRATFSVIRLSRKDPAEQAFIKMLMRTEPDLESEYASSVMVFPIFGRGRALFALVDRGINEDNIQEACEFLVGPCSCRVKRLNPGTDVLMAVDWDAALEEGPVEPQPAPTLPGSIASSVRTPGAGPPARSGPSGGDPPSGQGGRTPQPAAVYARKAPASAEETPAEESASLWPPLLWTMGGLVVAAGALGLWVKIRGTRT